MSETGIDIALRKGFYAVTDREMGRQRRALLEARPTCQFSELEPGKTYLYKPDTSYERARVLAIESVTPKRTQAMARIDGKGPYRVYQGNHRYGCFIELDADLQALGGTDHRSIVDAAVDAGLDVPPLVRRQYPELFVEIPERFAAGRFSAVERVKEALQPAPFQTEPVSVADVDRFIERAHFEIAHVRCERIRRIALNPDMAPDYDKIMRRSIDDLDFYRWLRRHIDAGGVFHIPGSDRNAA